VTTGGFSNRRPAAGGRGGPGPGPDSRLQTGILGFDHLTLGGLPRGRATLVVGPAGSGKTVFAGQFLCEGAERGEPAVFVTFEEPAVDLRTNLAGLGWDIRAWEEAGLWRFVDASPVAGEGGWTFDPSAGLKTLVAQVGEAVDRTAASRIVLDSLNVMLAALGDPDRARGHLRTLAGDLRRLGLTTVMTVEAPSPGGEVTLSGMEAFVADNVVVLRNVLEDEKRRRTIEVLKMRGAMHRKGEYPFTVLPGQGMVVIPRSVIGLEQPSGEERTTSGVEPLDRICHGGLFKDSVVLVSGATGTGKTLLVTEFLSRGAETGQRSLLLAFEESRAQLIRNARGWGRDFEGLEQQGLLKVVATYPEGAALEDHLVEITDQIESFGPSRIAIDSLSALERSGTAKGFREFIIVLTSYVKSKQITALFTATTPSLLGGPSITDSHISTLTDTIVLLRYVETGSEVRRGIAVLKMRGSPHDRRIHEFTIDDRGMHILAPFTGISGILAGRVVPLTAYPWDDLSPAAGGDVPTGPGEQDLLPSSEG